MSLILDALRKMEQDRRSRQGGAADIRPDVLRYHQAAKPEKARPYLLKAGMVLVLLAVGIGAGVFLKGSGGSPDGQGAEPAAPVAQVAPVAAPAPAVLPAAPPAVPSAAPALQPPPAASVPANQPAPVPAPVELSRSTNSLRGVAEASRPVRTAVADLPQAKTAYRESPEITPATLPEISISGIAYQDERRLRRAVLNGSLVGEGAEVAGARVVEIREDKVRLTRGGQVFEVALSSGSQPR